MSRKSRASYKAAVSDGFFVVRNLRRDDAEIIAFIKARLSERWILSTEQIERDYIEPSFLGGLPYIFVAFSPEGKFAGKIFLTIEPEGYLGIKDQPWIAALFVEEEFRNRGLAKELITAAEKQCSELGYRKMYLDTADAADYYRHIGGWEEIGKVFWEKGQEDLVIMSKDLAADTQTASGRTGL